MNNNNFFLGWSGSDYSSPAKKSFKHGSDNSSPAKKKSKHGRDYSICGEVDCDERRRKRSPGEEPEDLVDVQCCGNILAIRIWISIGIKILLIIIVDSNILK